MTQLGASASDTSLPSIGARVAARAFHMQEESTVAGEAIIVNHRTVVKAQQIRHIRARRLYLNACKWRWQRAPLLIHTFLLVPDYQLFTEAMVSFYRPVLPFGGQ